MNKKVCKEFLKTIGVPQYQLDYAVDMLCFIEEHPNARIIMGRNGPEIMEVNLEQSLIKV